MARIVSLLCIMAAFTATLAQPSPTPPTFKAPYHYILDNYLSDTDTVMSIETAVSETNSLTKNIAFGGVDLTLIRGDLGKTFWLHYEYGKAVCDVMPASTFDKTLSWKNMQLLDTVYLKGRSTTHYQQIFPDNRRIGLYIDEETGAPVRQFPTFQFATMVWDYWFFSNEAINPDVFKVPVECANATMSDDALIKWEDHVLQDAGLYQHYGKRVEFHRFMRKHGKQYNDADELEQRYLNFIKHDAMIAEHKMNKDRTYEMELNHMADYHPHEFRAARGRKVPANAMEMDKPYIVPEHHKLPGAFPASLDWREKGAVGLIRNQGMCGSCWAFGSMEALSGAHFLKTGKYMTLSPQNMVDCAWRNNCSGCDGCTARLAWTTVQQQGGVALDTKYPYIGVDGFYCNYTSTRDSGVTVSSWEVVKQGDIQGLYSAIQNGPLAIAIDAETIGLNFYTKGVYNDVKCLNGFNDLDHEVLLVGYGTENGEDYWLVKNSWGHLFGENGYIKIAVKGNICGVATDAVLPKV